MTVSYSFGIPGPLLWTTHIIIGLLLIYIGYTLLNNGKIGQLLTILLIVLGSVALLYHGHLFYYYRNTNIKQLPSI